MSLATRCPACGTIFRVVQDQLRVSEGWVRCGRCADVFNAVESLFDLERDQAPPWTPRAPEPSASPDPRAGDWSVAAGMATPAAHHAPAPQDDPSTTYPAAFTTAGPAPTDWPDAAPMRSEVDEAAPTAWDHEPTAYMAADEPAAPPPAPRHNPLTGLRRAEPMFDETPAPAPAATPEPAFVESSLREAPPDEPAAQAAGFVRRADRDARWHRPGVRLALGVLALALAGAAALQAMHAWRDDIAARWPAHRPLLVSMCEALGCTIEARRHVAGLSVEGSGLTRLESGNAYRLSLVLRNRDTTPLLLPSIDLTLTDAQGEVVARRVVAPAELGASEPDLGAGQELALDGLLQPGERRLAGYTIQIFYP